MASSPDGRVRDLTLMTQPNSCFDCHLHQRIASATLLRIPGL